MINKLSVAVIVTSLTACSIGSEPPEHTPKPKVVVELATTEVVMTTATAVDVPTHTATSVPTQTANESLQQAATLTLPSPTIATELPTELPPTATPSSVAPTDIPAEPKPPVPNKIWTTANVNCSISAYTETTSLTPKEYLASIGRNKPKSASEAEICILFSDNISDQIRKDHAEFHQILFDTLGAYDRFVHFIYNLDGNNDEAIAVLNEIGAYGGNIASIDELYEKRSCLSGFARFDNWDSKISEYKFCNQPNPLRHRDRYLDRPEIVNRYGLMHGWAHEYFHHYQNSHAFERAIGMYFECCGGYNHINTPAWFTEGSANLFPTYLLRNVFYDLSVTKENNLTYPTQSGHDIDGRMCSAILCDLDRRYKEVKKHMMGLGDYESGGVTCREFSALEESRDTGLCGVSGWTTANAYLAYTTSYETLFVDIYEDIWQLGFPDSFKKHVGMTTEEFYIQFTEFMRQGSVDDPPPPGFFPDKPLSELADFWSIDSG